MNTHQLHMALPTEEKPLKDQLQHILHCEDLHVQRGLLSVLLKELNADVFDCAAALLRMVQQDVSAPVLLTQDKSVPSGVTPLLVDKSEAGSITHDIRVLEPPILPISYVMPTIKMVRYRLDIGKKHQLTVKELKKVLVEESGVDKNNINNVMIHAQYTLIELPDAMPQDIFQHLKTVEINNQKLNIKRLKSHPKKQSVNRFRRSKQRNTPRSDDTAN